MELEPVGPGRTAEEEGPPTSEVELDVLPGGAEDTDEDTGALSA